MNPADLALMGGWRGAERHRDETLADVLRPYCYLSWDAAEGAELAARQWFREHPEARP